MSADLRVAVVGVGYLGEHHARIWSSLPGCRLVTVVDRDEARAREIAGRHGARASTAPDAAADGVDLVSIAVPTEAHREVAEPILARGIPVLVEKPMARTIEDAEAMIAAARRGGAALGVGHTERFNPAVEAMRGRIDGPRFIECHRLGSFSPRSLDIDVVLDLMIHDLDIALALTASRVRSVDAIGVAALTPKVDIANARVVFESGCVANLTASRISASRTRKIRVFQRRSYLSCDCSTRALEHYRLEEPDAGAAGPRIRHESVVVPPDEPLRRELQAFAASVRGEAPFAVTGDAGREALRVALAIVDRIEAAGGTDAEAS